MSTLTEPSPPPPSRSTETASSAAVIARGAVSPLLAVLAPLVVAAILISALFSWAFPNIVPPGATPAARFTDVTAESGIHFSHYNGSAAEQEPPTTLGGGVVCLDYNNDGATDLFFVNGASWPWQETTADGPHLSALYKNDGMGHFTDVTVEAGLAFETAGVSAAVGDYDNDGWPDLFVTAIGENRLFHNDGHGHFVDVTETAGLPKDDHVWSTGALWLDVDGDQRLDLIVCHYARWPREIELELAFKIAGVGRSYGAPAGFVSMPPSVYRNLGDGHFENITAKSGLRDIDPLTNLPRAGTIAVLPLDANGDGKVDLLFVHQNVEDSLFLNQGDGTFREFSSRSERREGTTAGIASLAGVPFSRPTAAGDAYLRWRNGQGGGMLDAVNFGFLPLNAKAGVAVGDFDLEGRLEVFASNGRAEPDVNRFDAGRAFAERPSLYWDRGDGWAPVPSAPELPPLASVVARGMVTADLDGDGDNDVVIAQNGGPARVLRNDLHSGVGWLRIQLVGTKSPRDGTGARVEVHTPRGTISRLALPAMGLLAQSEPPLIFGLAEDTRVRKVVVIWPSGIRQEILSPTINQRLVITEPRS